MLDYGALPPEVNSARMYSGPGSGSMMTAAAAWEGLANGLESVSRGYVSVISHLQGESWKGGASAAMGSAAAPYIAWCAATSAIAEQTGAHARAAAAAYENAFASMVPPALVTANRMQLANLVATNFLGQNSALIGQIEATYEEMWAQDAASMYTYAASSAAATALPQYQEPQSITNGGEQGAQSAAVVRAVGSSTGGRTQMTLSQVMSAVPTQLQALATTGSSGLPASSAASVPPSLLSAFSGFNTLTAPVDLGDGISRTLTSAGSFQTGLIRSNLQAAAEGAKDAGDGAKAVTTAAGHAGLSGPVTASASNAGTAGKLSVPPRWAAPNPAAASTVEPVWLSDAELEGGPSWHEAGTTNMWGGVPPTGTGTSSGPFSRPSVNNVLRVAARQYKMPRPSLGG
jgi:PPE-repeat protein